MLGKLVLPTLNPRVANLAGILPLSGLLELSGAPKALHSYQLSGRGLLWNWPLTPAGARLLLDANDQASVCCLDHPVAAPILHCMDGKWGDQYPCPSPFTVRTCIAGAKVHQELTTVAASAAEARDLRKQQLQIVRVLTSPEDQQRKSKGKLDNVVRFFRMIFQDAAWVCISVAGWTFWLGVVATCFGAAQYIAAAYLLILLLTGIVVRHLHGHDPRKLLNASPGAYNRLVVTADSLGGNNWTVFIGESVLVNALLNKPLHQARPVEYSRHYRGLLRLLVALQWGFTAVSCAFQDWNALIIFASISVAAFFSTYGYSEHRSVRDWLNYNRVQLEVVKVNLSTRRSMLSAIVALNPDKQEQKWINPILAPSTDRAGWEDALIKQLKEEPIPAGTETRYWWPFILEGIEAARMVKQWLPEM